MLSSYSILSIYYSIFVHGVVFYLFFFFSSRRRHTRFDCDWSSDVCSSDLLDAARHQRVGAAHGDLGAELREAPDVGARDARVQDVADEAHLHALDPPQLVADREQVEEGLGGVLVLAVPGVHDVGADAVAQELRRARGGVADHHHVDAHRLEVLGRIDERLPLLHRASRGGHVHGVRGEALFGEFEGDAGAGGGFEEEIDDRLAAQRGDLLDGALRHFLERLRGVEDEADLVGREALEADQILAQRGRHCLAPRTTSTWSRPSSSATCTSTTSPGPVLTTLPTTSAWIGSSRPPRSTRTHSEIRLGRPKSASSSRAARTVRPV